MGKGRRGRPTGVLSRRRRGGGEGEAGKGWWGGAYCGERDIIIFNGAMPFKLRLIRDFQKWLRESQDSGEAENQTGSGHSLLNQSK